MDCTVKARAKGIYFSQTPACACQVLARLRLRRPPVRVRATRDLALLFAAICYPELPCLNPLCPSLLSLALPLPPLHPPSSLPLLPPPSPSSPLSPSPFCALSALAPLPRTPGRSGRRRLGRLRARTECESARLLQTRCWVNYEMYGYPTAPNVALP